jgi:hypothetical protein
MSKNNNFSKKIRITNNTKAIRNNFFNIFNGKFSQDPENTVYDLCEQKITTTFKFVQNIYSFKDGIKNSISQDCPLLVNIDPTSTDIPTPTSTPTPTDTSTETPPSTPTDTPTETSTSTPTVALFDTCITTSENPDNPAGFIGFGPIGVTINSMEPVVLCYNDLNLLNFPALNPQPLLSLNGDIIAAIDVSPSYAGQVFRLTIISTGISYSFVVSSGTVILQ